MEFLLLDILAKKFHGMYCGKFNPSKIISLSLNIKIKKKPDTHSPKTLGLIGIFSNIS